MSFSRIGSIGTSQEKIDLSEWDNICGDKINYLEHVEISVNLNYTRRGELLMKLTSPQGTVSNLTHYREADASFGAKDLNWVLMTLHHWGETAIGPWTLTMESSHPDHANTGRLTIGSLSNDVFERWTSTGSGRIASLGSGLVKTLG